MPGTCIQVGGAAPPSPHPPTPVPDLLPCHQPTKLLGGPVSPAASPGRRSGGCSQGAGEAAGWADRAAPRPQGWRTDVLFSAPQQLCDLQCSECPRWVSGPRAAGGRGLDSNLSSEPDPCLPRLGWGCEPCTGDWALVGDRGATCLEVWPGSEPRRRQIGLAPPLTWEVKGPGGPLQAPIPHVTAPLVGEELPERPPRLTRALVPTVQELGMSLSPASPSQVT